MEYKTLLDSYFIPELANIIRDYAKDIVVGIQIGPNVCRVQNLLTNETIISYNIPSYTKLFVRIFPMYWRFVLYPEHTSTLYLGSLLGRHELISISLPTVISVELEYQSDRYLYAKGHDYHRGNYQIDVVKGDAKELSIGAMIIGVSGKQELATRFFNSGGGVIVYQPDELDCYSAKDIVEIPLYQGALLNDRYLIGSCRGIWCYDRDNDKTHQIRVHGYHMIPISFTLYGDSVLLYNEREKAIVTYYIKEKECIPLCKMATQPVVISSVNDYIILKAGHTFIIISRHETRMIEESNYEVIGVI